jgi:hypothetical protein
MGAPWVRRPGLGAPVHGGAGVEQADGGRQDVQWRPLDGERPVAGVEHVAFVDEVQPPSRHGDAAGSQPPVGQPGGDHRRPRAGGEHTADVAGVVRALVGQEHPAQVVGIDEVEQGQAARRPGADDEWLGTEDDEGAVRGARVWAADDVRAVGDLRGRGGVDAASSRAPRLAGA